MTAIDAFAEVFGEATYDPLLATPPSLVVERELLKHCPRAASSLCKEILWHYKDHGPVTPRHIWAAIGELVLEQPSVARWPLAYVTMLHHEWRHHIDFYATSLGVQVIMALAQEYAIIAGAIAATQDDAGDITWVERHRRHLDMRARIYEHGGVARADMLSVPYNELPFGLGKSATLRVRRVPTEAATWPVLSLCRAEREWFMSTVALLEVRALIEVQATAAGYLYAAGQPAKVVDGAARLLFAGLDRSPEWYWGLFAAVGGGTSDDQAADGWWHIAGPLLTASWFAINGPVPTTTAVTTGFPMALPTFRFGVALTRLQALTEGLPGKWFVPEELYEQLAENLEEPFTLGDRQMEWLARLELTSRDNSLGEGPARDHIRQLARVATDTITAREPSGSWVDSHSGDEHNNILGVSSHAVSLADASRAAVESLRNCRRFSKLAGATDRGLAQRGEWLMPALPRPFVPDPVVYPGHQ